MTAPLDAHDVAVIGMSGRFPRARNLDAFWDNLRNGRECISRFSADDLASAGIDPRALTHPGYVNAGGVVDDIELFDAEFFGVNPREAEITDPQQRLFLECSWEALEQAGYDPHRYKGLIGVYGGVGMSRYLFNILSNPELMAAVGQVQVVLGNDKDHLTTRVAYKLNLKGPAVTIQTACSTSLVAVALAYQSLLDYQCDMALAGGVTIGVPQTTGYVYQPGGINSPDGHCRAFDAEAQGTVGGNGIGVVLLKRYADALADRDAVHAVIKGAALNNDGAVKVGYTAPSIDGQASVIAMAQALAGVHPDTVTYVEAHGTGTPLGDPIEVAALTQVFRASTRRTGYCAIGSVKTNIGHLDCGAGVAGLIKAVLALKHRELPPSLHYRQANPRIDFADSPFYVNTELRPWDTPALPRRAGVSSFGIGGTNAHVVVEEAPAPAPSAGARAHALLAVSARSAAALDTVSRDVAAHLARSGDEIADAAYTTAVGRRAFPFRRAVVAADAAAAVRGLTAAAPAVSTAATRPRRLAFLFPGQGTQYPQMGAGLLQAEPVFREHADECFDALRPLLGYDLREVIYPSEGDGMAPAARLDATAVTQPAIFVVEYALARLLESWGLRADAMLGHSVGEYVAACLAGVFSLRDALALVVRRGALMQAMPPGAMLAVSLPAAEVPQHLGAALDLAAVNAAAQCVLSGPPDAIAAAEAELSAARILCRRVTTSHAFHSRMMAAAAEALVDVVAGVERHPPERLFLSNVTGDWMPAAFATDPVYWARQLRQTVLFDDALSRLVADPEWALIEVGPGVTLSTLARQHPNRRPEQVVTATMRHPRDSKPDDAALLEAVAHLWTRGVDVNWEGFYERERRVRVHLPTYPFERRRYWVEARRPAAPPSDDRRSGMARSPDIRRWLYRPEWQPSPAPGADAAPERASWLIFEDRCGLAAAIAASLRDSGHDVAIATPGERFLRESGDHYRVNPARADDYVALLESLDAAGGAPSRILHLWTVTRDAASCAESRSLPSLQDLGFVSLLHLAQAIGRRRVAHPVHLAVVSNGICAVGAEPLVPEKATVLGPVRVIPQELPHVRCRVIDLVLPETNGSTADALADGIVGECSRADAEPVLAMRDGALLVPVFPAAPEIAEPHASPFRARGVYLVTGAFGGIGLAIAEHLASTLSARLVLIGRTGLPLREEWPARLAAAPDDSDRTARAIRRIQAMEAAGSEVLTLAGDVTDEAAMRQALAVARERFGTLTGVIHCAGVPGGGMLLRKTADAARRVMAPKVTGTLVLDALTREDRPELFAVCSSLSSILGGFGQIDYCAANAFLDAFAHARARLAPGRTVAIDWDTWREAGMAVDTAVPQELAAARAHDLALGLTNDEGVRVFESAAASGLPQVLVSTIDLDVRRQGYVASPPGEHAAAAPSAPSVSDTARHPRPELETPYRPPREGVETTVALIWQDTLGIAPIGADDDFFALGGHSLLAVQVVSRLREALQRDVPVHILFDAPTISQLAASLADRADPATDAAQGLDRVVDFVERLSDEEVRRMLGEPPESSP